MNTQTVLLSRTDGKHFRCSLLLDSLNVGGSRRPNVIRKCTTRVHSALPLSPVSSDIRYNGAKLMKAMQQHLEHVMIVQCQHNLVFRCVCAGSVVNRLRAGSRRIRASTPGRGKRVISSKHPDRFLSPPSFLLNRHERLFPWE
jgi:hypothetical protein